MKRWTIHDRPAIVAEAERQLRAGGVDFEHVELACIDNDFGHDAIVYVYLRRPQEGVIARAYGIDQPRPPAVAA